MAWDRDTLRYVWEKTDGYCAYCEKRLSWINYGQHGERGAWHVDHSRSRANGGTDHRANLFAACTPCNLDKGARNGKSYRVSVGGSEEEGWGIMGGLLALGGLAFLVHKLRNGTKPSSSFPPAPPNPFDPFRPR